MLTTIKNCLAKAVEQEAEFGVCLLYGQESFLHSFLLKALKKILSRDESVTVEKYDYSQLRLSEVIFSWDVLSLFAAKKIIVLSSLENLKKKDAELLVHWVQEHQGSKGVYLFLLASKFDGRSTLYRVLRQQGVVINSDNLRADDLRRLIMKKAAVYDVTLAPGVLDALLHYHDNNLQMIMREVEKLALYVGRGEVIKSEELELLGCSTATAKIFKLIDELGAGRIVAALQLLDRLLREKTVPLVILNLVVRHYRLLALVCVPANREKTDKDLAKALQIQSFVVRKLRRQCRNFSLSRLADNFKLLSEVDRQLKSSRIPDQLILEKMVMSLCQKSR